MKNLFRNTIFFLIAILHFSVIHAIDKWTKVFDLDIGLGNAAWNVQAVATTDNGYAIAYTNYYQSDQSNELAVMKIDNSGSFVWKQTYNFDESTGAYWGLSYKSLIATDDNGIVVWGIYCCPPNGGYNGFLLRLDEFGEVMWFKTIGETESNLNVILLDLSVVQNVTGNFLVSGWGVNRFETPAGIDYWDGFWTAEISGNGTLISENFQKNNVTEFVVRDAYNIIPTSDEGALISGEDSDLGGIDQAQRAWISKYDSSGNLQWQKDYDSENIYDAASISIPDSSENYYIGLLDFAGTSVLYNMATYAQSIMKINSSGSMIWHKKYDLENFYVAGTTEGELILASRYPTGEETSDIQLTKIDDSGDVVWSKTIDFLTFDDPQSIIKSPDGGTLVVGITECDWYHPQLFLLKLDENGDSCMDEEEQFVGYYEPEIVTETPYSIWSVSATAPLNNASSATSTFGGEAIDFCPEEFKAFSKNNHSLNLIDYCGDAVLTIVKPQNFEIYGFIEPEYHDTGQIPFIASSTNPSIPSVEWNLKLEYRTYGNRCQTCDFEINQQEDIENTYERIFDSMGGKLTTNLKASLPFTDEAQSKTNYIAGAPIPPSVYTPYLVSLYQARDGNTPGLYTGFAMTESSYRHFCIKQDHHPFDCTNPAFIPPDNLHIFWPHEGPGGGHHVGLMMFEVSMESAWNWQMNAELADVLFGQKLQIVTTEMNNQINSHQGLQPLGALELERWAVCEYGPEGELPLYVPIFSGGTWIWQENSANENGSKYVNRVYENIQN